MIVRGVEYKLQQVFLNLFLNARDAMPKGGWLSVTTTVSGEALVEVADTGVGIPAEHLSRIYDPFFTTKSEGRGTGLGLSVTYGIVQEHGGTLTCDSDLGQGTRFRLSCRWSTLLPGRDRSRRALADSRRLPPIRWHALRHHSHHRRRRNHPRGARGAADGRGLHGAMAATAEEGLESSASGTSTPCCST